MRLAADLHLHSRYADGVSPAITLENLAVWALRKGLDLLGTGDCLQADWLREIEAGTVDAEPGLRKLTPELEQRVAARVPERVRRPLRFVLSTEVDCLPPPRTKYEGLHHLLYFPSLEHARSFADGLRSHGDLREGRPTVNLSPLQLLERALEQGPDCHFAPAHVFNPWYSDLGTVGGETSLDEIYVDHVFDLLAVETGLTATPAMCRRVSSLDPHALFSCSDAHSLENLGREYTIVDAAPDYRALFAALRDGSTRRVVGMVKYPLHLFRYFLNWCSHCKRSHDAQVCPDCRRKLTAGSRDRLAQIADRAAPVFAPDEPPFQELRPLAEVIAGLLGNNADSPATKAVVQALLERVGHERHVLCDATEREIADVATPQLARAIAAQRRAPTEFFQTATPAATRPAETAQGWLDLA